MAPTWPVTFLVLLLTSATGCLTMDAAVSSPTPGSGALIVPRMGARPVLDAVIGEGEWNDTVTWSGAFIIASGTPADGTYPFVLKLGADEKNLYALLQMEPLGPNPWTVPGRSMIADNFEMLLTSTRATKLGPPAYYVSASHIRDYHVSTNSGYWSGEAWVFHNEYRGDGSEDFNQGRPDTLWIRHVEAEDGVTTEWVIPRTPGNPKFDSVDMRGPSAFKLALAFVRQDGVAEHGREDLPRDIYPGNTIAAERDPTGWQEVFIPF